MSSCSVSRLQVANKDIDDDQSTKQAKVYKRNDTDKNGWHIKKGHSTSDNMVGKNDREADIPTLLIPSLRLMINLLFNRHRLVAFLC